VEANSSLGQDFIGWRQSKTTGETLREKVIVRQFAQAKNVIFAGADAVMDTTNTESQSEIKKEAEERKLHRMAKVHDILKMWQGSQNLRATQKETPRSKRADDRCGIHFAHGRDHGSILVTLST
jgi:hypothetical protein